MNKFVQILDTNKKYYFFTTSGLSRGTIDRITIDKLDGILHPPQYQMLREVYNSDGEISLISHSWYFTEDELFETVADAILYIQIKEDDKKLYEEKTN